MGWKTKTFLGIVIAIPMGLTLSNAYFSHQRKEEWYAGFVGYPQRPPNCPDSDLCLTAKNGWQINIPKNDPQIFIDQKRIKKEWNRPSYAASIVIEPGNKKNFVRFRDMNDPSVKIIIRVAAGMDITKESENRAKENNEEIFEAEINPEMRNHIDKNQHYYIFNQDCANKVCRFQGFINDPENATGALASITDNLTGIKLQAYLTQRGINNYRMLLTEVSKDIKKWSQQMPGKIADID